MITALCLNPSLDRTVYVERLERGGTNRVLREQTVPGGKGVNVARMMASFGLPSRAALFLGREDERLMEETLSGWGCGMRAVMLDGALRVNIKVMDQSRGEITELNAPGSPVNDRQLEAMEDLVIESAAQSRWLCLCGSLPPGSPVDWYVKLTTMARSVGVKVVVDSHGPALDAVVAAAETTPPDLISPNVAELQQVTGQSIRSALVAGDLEPAIEAVMDLRERGVPCVLATLGARGALLSCEDGLWYGEPEPVQPVSVAGAGDAALAGMLLASVRTQDPAYCLDRAVAYGTATVLLPGSEVPTPEQADTVALKVTQLA